MVYLLISILCLSIIVITLIISMKKYNISYKKKAFIFIVLLISTVSFQNYLVKVLNFQVEYFAWVLFILLILIIVTFEIVFIRKIKR